MEGRESCVSRSLGDLRAEVRSVVYGGDPSRCHEPSDVRGIVRSSVSH